ncbi:MAG TPA: hypothetical protein VKQ54_15075 [Caulobacteraceae bacterium]|nr:hypothetical protein [Caulobacteraceae bacterium]
MSEEKLQFLEGAPSSAPTFAEASAGREASEGRPANAEPELADRGPDGRFLTAVPVTPSENKPETRLREDGHVPISALLDEREKRQAEKAQREALEQRIAEMRAQAAPPRELAPTEQLEVALYSQNLRASRRFAEREYGKDAVATLHDWAFRRCEEDPLFNEQMRSSDDPYEAAFQAYNREQILQTVRPGDLAAFKAWQASSAKASAYAKASADTPEARASHDSNPNHRSASQTPVPRSLATASGTGGAGAPHTPIGPGLAFANALNR